MESEPRAEAPDWPAWKRYGFRFLAAYFVLYTLPFPLAFVPGLGGLTFGAVNGFWQSAGPWVGHRLLGIEGEIFLGPTGSGDTTLDFIKLLMMVVLSGAIAAIWSALDRGRASYPVASRWLVVGVRFYLGYTMLQYGLAKVIPTQFSQPSLVALLTPFGDSSPMGLVWKFMGHSPAYTVFSGIAETLGGVLLFFRRTRMLGALVVVPVMTNVVMLNYAYDVPVKLYSSHLLLMAFAILAIDGRRLVDFLVRNRAVPPADLRPLFRNRRADLAARAAALLLLGFVLVSNTSNSLNTYRTFGNGRPRSEIHGIWDVESFVANGEESPALLTDELRWRALVVDRALPLKLGFFERPGGVAVMRMDGSFAHFSIELDAAARTIARVPEGHMSIAAAREAGAASDELLAYELADDGGIRLRGRWEGAEIDVQAQARDTASIELLSRGFHWINELPRNR